MPYWQSKWTLWVTLDIPDPKALRTHRLRHLRNNTNKVIALAIIVIIIIVVIVTVIKNTIVILILGCWAILSLGVRPHFGGTWMLRVRPIKDY